MDGLTLLMRNATKTAIRYDIGTNHRLPQYKLSSMLNLDCLYGSSTLRDLSEKQPGTELACDVKERDFFFEVASSLLATLGPR